MWLSQRGVIVALVLWVAIRWIFAAARELVPDEAYYWVWSRHLALSYFDHPPMVAYLIRLGTILAGENELGVRWWAGLMTAATMAILALTAKRLTGDVRAAVFVAMMLLLSPMINVIGLIVTPDTPLCFFTACALGCVLLIFAPNSLGEDLSRGKLWLAFGVFLGLAMLSKYTAILLGIAVAGAMLSSADGRRHFFMPWPWLGAVFALAVFSPVIMWNAQHNWASFRFQLHHGLGSSASSPWKNLLEYFGGQLALATPVFFVFLLIVLAVYFYRQNNPMHIRILLAASTLPIVFFAWSALHKHVEANWPLMAYLPGALLIGHYLSENWSRRRIFWAEVAMKVALVGTILIHFPEATWAVRPSLGTPLWDELFGWRTLATEVEKEKQDSPVFTTDYEFASELSFYLPGHPSVWPLREPSRPTVFDFIGTPPDIGSLLRMLIVRRGNLGMPDSLRPYFQEFQRIHFETIEHQRMIRETTISVASKVP
ncbi:MAG: glycosyltransferase family 39 protein [Planctomycetota bacterium]|nr:glycosyltransferase family 39 protein [Planctomycetota bacterium]